MPCNVFVAIAQLFCFALTSAKASAHQSLASMDGWGGFGGEDVDVVGKRCLEHNRAIKHGDTWSVLFKQHQGVSLKIFAKNIRKHYSCLIGTTLFSHDHELFFFYLCP